MITAVRALVLAAGVALGAGLPGPAAAAEWGGISPGTTTMDAVRGRYGPPSREVTQKVEGYDTRQWIYEGGRAPSGIRRLTVEFGMLTPAGFRRDVVRLFMLEPARGVFDRQVILTGWGKPSGATPPGEPPAFYYQDGLIVYFDRDGQSAERMVFTPPQPSARTPAGPRP